MSQPAVTPQQTVQPDDVPKVTLELLTGDKPEVERAGGIFTKEDLINLKLYVKKGLSLPSKLPELEVYIGYTKSGIAGLEPPDIKMLFDRIRNHCLGWDHVQTEVINQSISLDHSAEQIVGTGDNLIELIDQWPFYERVKKLGVVSDQELEGISLGENDPEAKVALGDYLEQLRQIIETQETKTTAVQTLVHDYRIVLVGGNLSNGTIEPGLEPEVHEKSKLMETNNLKQKIADDQEDLADKESRIEQLKKDYDKYVGLAFTGAAGGVIGLAITGGIFGDKAEKARKEKNKLIKEVRALRAKLRGAQALQKAIEGLSDDFDDIGIRMLDAEIALGHLQFMWQSILERIRESQNQWNNIDNGKAIVAFLNTFKLIVNPWRDVKGMAGFLIRVIDEALEEYKRVYGG